VTKEGLLYRGGRALWILVAGFLVMAWETAKAIDKYLLKVFSLLSGAVEVLAGKKVIGPPVIYALLGGSIFWTGIITYHLLHIVSPLSAIFMIVAGFTICGRGLILVLKSPPTPHP
jgi:hypothetical protein